MFETTPYNINPDDVLPDRKVPPYPAGLYDGEKSHVRYAQPSLKTPTLTIVDSIYNIDGEPVIIPGHYELALSNDNKFLMILQSKNILVKIPVFKLERDDAEIQEKFEKKQEKTEWWNFRQKRLKKKLDNKQKQVGLNPDKNKFVYSEATIEWVIEGEYFLLKYECGSTRAWGAIKQTRF